MPGHAGSPFWTAVDFGSEDDDDHTDQNHRFYLDPWDNEACGIIPTDSMDSSQSENINSFAGEPVSGSFYYVPTKNYDSEEDTPPLPPPQRRNVTPPETLTPDYSIYGRRLSRPLVPDLHPEMAIYGQRPIRHRRMSMYIEEPIYAPYSMIYEPLYGHLMPPPPPGYLPSPSRPRIPHPEFITTPQDYGKQRKQSRMMDAYGYLPYESLSPEYEDWARPFPKTAPDNFHLSRYGHLQIDYSCSWNSLDRLIRNQ